MITIEEKKPEMLEVNISEIFSREDIKQLMPILKKYARNSVRPRLLLVARDFHGWYGAGPWWSDLKLDDECDCNVAFQCIALIGDQNWKTWMITFVSSFTSCEIKFFTHEKISRAHKWLNSKDNIQSRISRMDGKSVHANLTT